MTESTDGDRYSRKECDDIVEDAIGCQSFLIEMRGIVIDVIGCIRVMKPASPATHRHDAFVRIAAFFDYCTFTQIFSSVYTST